MHIKPRIPQIPKNESIEHFYLKQVAKVWLKTQRGCQLVGSEIRVGNSTSGKKQRKHIADVVGAKEKGKWKYEIFVIEVKVSRSDFLSGFNQGGNYNWVMTPKGILTKKDMPRNVGLIEVDLDLVKWHTVKTNRKGREKVEIHGLDIVKQATKKDNLKKDMDRKIAKKIGKRLTINDVYKNIWFY